MTMRNQLMPNGPLGVRRLDALESEIAASSAISTKSKVARLACSMLMMWSSLKDIATCNCLVRFFISRRALEDF
jgi:hypothetical protein